MQIPIMKGVIQRRILANYRIKPAALLAVLPPPFRPLLLRGYGVGGICLIRLAQVRPRFMPGFLGISSENAAHRFAVEWEQDGELRHGVYIPRRDTSSQLNKLAGGRIFPGIHHHARFEVAETADHLSVQMDSDDGEVHVAVRGQATRDLPAGSLFGSLAEASRFFEEGSLGYSATDRPGAYDALELRTFDWRATALEVEKVESSYFENRKLFPAGSVEFDCALLMRDIEHEWHGQAALSHQAEPACCVAAHAKCVADQE